MDIRDILKSFDNLSEATTATDKGTVHKAGPGGYGNKHGSEDVTDQYGKPIARMSLGKMGLANEPKRGKGRPPNPDKAKEYDSTALNKAMGIGKAPKATGKPSVKHSLKEYFDQLDQALVEANQIEIKPASQMPKQPGQTSQPAQPGQRQQMAGQPQKNTQVIAQGGKTLGTVDDPQLANQIKQSIGQGKMTLNPQQQMEEEGSNWIKGAIKHPGAFTKKASSHGMTPKEFANKVLAHKKDYPAKTEKQAQLAKTLGKMHHEGEMEEAVKAFSTSDYDRGLSMPNLTRPTDQVGRNKLAATVKQNRQANPGMRGAMSGQSKPQDGEGEARISSNSNVREAEMPTHYGDMGAGLGSGRSQQFEGGVAKQGFVILDPKLMAQIEPMDGTEVENDIVFSNNPNITAKLMAFAKANPHRLKISSSMSDTGGARPIGNQFSQASGPELVEGKKGVNPFAKKDTKKKPDENNNNIPDYAEDGKGKNDLKKKGAAPKKGVNPFAKKTEKKKDKISEGMMDKLKGILVPKLMKLLGPDAEKIASAVKQAAGGNLTPSKENAIKVAQALGLDKAAKQGQSPQMAEGIAGNWQGKLIQALYTLGLLGSAGAAASMFGTITGGNMAVIGFLLLMFADTFFGDAPGQIGAYGKFGNKGTNAQHGLDDNGMPVKNTNVDESTKKKKVKEGMEHHLQAARLEGKSHALRKMPYNCTHDDMEEARCYHDGFKEGLDECYGQMPILGRTAVDEMGQGPEVATMASYGADDMGMDEGNAFTAGLAKTPHGGKFKVGGSTFTDRTRYDSNLDEFAFESLDKQLNAILENKEVSEGMTVSISKGQQGAPDSVSVSAQDGEADQLLSIIKSAGMGLFGGDEQNGYGAPHGTAGAHGGISVVDDHDGMMALMKKLSGAGGDMPSGGDYENEEGHEGHGEEGHSHEGEEDSCNECGYMESQCQCDHGDEQQVVDEVESEDQMLYNVAEDNLPDSEEEEHASIANAGAKEDSALATADAGADEEEAKIYSSPTNEAEDETGEEAGKEKVDEGTCKKCDCKPCKCETVAESFANLYKKLAFLSEESTSEKDDKAEKAAKKVAKDIEYDEGHKGKDDDRAEEAGEKVKKDIEYDDKKDKKEKKLDEWANEAGKNGTDASFEADIDFMTKVISGGLNKQKSTGQTTIPVINGQKSRMGVDGLGSPMKESNDLLKDYRKLSGL